MDSYGIVWTSHPVSHTSVNLPQPQFESHLGGKVFSANQYTPQQKLQRGGKNATHIFVFGSQGSMGDLDQHLQSLPTFFFNRSDFSLGHLVTSHTVIPHWKESKNALTYPQRTLWTSPYSTSCHSCVLPWVISLLLGLWWIMTPQVIPQPTTNHWRTGRHEFSISAWCFEQTAHKRKLCWKRHQD